MTYGIHHGLFFSFFSHREMVWNGDFDRLLVRPLSPVWQIMASGLNLPALGEFLPGFTLLCIAAPKVQVAWTPLNVLYLIVIVLSGAVIEWAVNLFFMKFNFWLERATLLWLPDIFSGQASRIISQRIKQRTKHCVGIVQRLRDNARLADDRHVIHITGPAGNDVQVNVLDHSGTSHTALVHAHVKALRTEDLAQRAQAVLNEPHHFQQRRIIQFL